MLGVALFMGGNTASSAVVQTAGEYWRWGTQPLQEEFRRASLLQPCDAAALRPGADERR